jgi:hypothetical protein
MRPLAIVLRTTTPCASSGQIEFGRIRRGAGDLLAAIDAADGLSD